MLSSRKLEDSAFPSGLRRYSSAGEDVGAVPGEVLACETKRLPLVLSFAMAQEFQTFLKLFRIFRPQSPSASTAAATKADAETEASKTTKEQASGASGLPIGDKVRVVFRGAANPDLVGILEINNPPLLLEHDALGKKLEFRIGDSVFRLDDVESWCRL